MDQAENPEHIEHKRPVAPVAKLPTSKAKKFNPEDPPYTAIGQMVDWAKEHDISRNVISAYFDANQLPRGIVGAERFMEDIKKPEVVALIRVMNWAQSHKPPSGPFDMRAVAAFMRDEGLDTYADFWQRIQADDRDIVAAIEQRNRAYAR
jgi:hypothetical protein